MSTPLEGLAILFLASLALLVIAMLCGLTILVWSDAMKEIRLLRKKRGSDRPTT